MLDLERPTTTPCRTPPAAARAATRLAAIDVTGEVASEDWRPPGGVFDFDVLADPQALTNVRGGFGFVGAAYPFEIPIRPDALRDRADELPQRRPLPALSRERRAALRWTRARLSPPA